jgi:hypothetical protein
MTKDEIIACIRALAEKLGRTPTVRELVKAVKGITRYGIHRAFGSHTNALRACGIATPGSGRVPEMSDLFLEWAEMARALRRVPTITEYDRRSRYSVRPLINRFGNWQSVPVGMRVYAEQEGLAAQWTDVLELVVARERQRAERAARAKPVQPAVVKPKVHRLRARPDRPIFGPPMMSVALAHGPTNEAGVIYLFGMMATRLGFVVTRIQSEFPDCEAMCEVEKDRWQRVRIEFEYESRNFLKHCHREEECDVIVCWLHNWPDCPLDVVELRGVVAGI